MKENVLENPVELRTAMPAPHFDDKRVVLRAQRVVPLQEIRSRVRLRKLVYLGGAFAIAIMLGAASALIAVHIKRSGTNGVSQIQLTNNTEPEAPVEQTAAVQVDPAETALIDETQTPLDDESLMQPVVKPVVAPKKETPLAQRPRSVARENQPLAQERRGVEPSEEEQLEQIRESVLYEQWQERRLRRAARRERRRSGRDLSRVDEIFEGPRRPERPY